MTYAPGEDPVDQLLRTEADQAHARAQIRGFRLRALTRAIELALRGAGLPFEIRARPIIFHVLAYDLYGHAAIDIPPLLTEDADAPETR
jgi:hypothetical protein